MNKYIHNGCYIVAVCLGACSVTVPLASIGIGLWHFLSNLTSLKVIELSMILSGATIVIITGWFTSKVLTEGWKK